MNSQDDEKDVSAVVTSLSSPSQEPSALTGGNAAQSTPISELGGPEASLHVIDLTRPVKTVGESSLSTSTALAASVASDVGHNSKPTAVSEASSRQMVGMEGAFGGSHITPLGSELGLTPEEQAAAFKKANILAVTSLAKRGPSAREMISIQAKLQKFLTGLISLAGKNGPHVKLTVQLLVKKLVTGTITEEEFAANLEKDLRSQHQPSLLPFLKSSVPHMKTRLQLQQGFMKELLQRMAAEKMQKHSQQPPVRGQQPEQEPGTFEGGLKQRLDQALKNRHKVNAQITKVVFIGPAGSGKSHLLSALVGEDPDEYRNSTPCAKRGVRAIACQRALVGKQSHWKLLKGNEFESMIVKRIYEKVESTSLHGSDACSATTSSTDTASTDTANINTATDTANTTMASTDTAVKPSDFEELINHLSARGAGTTSYSLDGTHWIIFVDTGGQLQYHEVFRAFIRNASLNLIVIKLNDRLDQEPSDDFYIDGRKVCQFGTYNLTNRQLITRLLNAAQSYRNTTRASGPIPNQMRPACFIVGTHMDKERECSELCSSKNRKLTETLQPYTDVVYPKRKSRRPGRNEWIFPVNAKPPFTKDQKQRLQDLRECIMEHSKEKSPDTPLAMAWYALEIRMEMLREKGQRVISLADCRQIADALQFLIPDEQTGEDDLLLCLEYLDALGLIVYIPSILPDVIFIDPQLLLDMVSELIASCCRLRGDDDSYRLPYTCSAKEIEKFTEWGLFSVPFLKKCFSTHYVNGIFTAQNFVDLLTQVLIAAPLDETHDAQYFMPCLLKDSTTLQLSTASDHSCFLVHFQTVCPLGLFCAMVAFMLSSPAEPHLSFCCDKIEHFSQYCVAFEVGGDYGCTVTLFDNDSALRFELYIDKTNLNNEELSELCPALRAKVLKGIEEASNKHHYQVSTRDAFFCSPECPNESVHVAHVISGDRLMCTETKKKFPLMKEQKYWMQTLSASTSVDQTSRKRALRKQITGDFGDERSSDARCRDIYDDGPSTSKIPKLSSSKGYSQPPALQQIPHDPVGYSYQGWLHGLPESLPEYPYPRISMTGPQSTYMLNHDPPTLLELIRFRGRERRINVPLEIGFHYMTFGTLLLQDPNGMRIRNMETKHLKNAEQINMEILQEWVNGSGKQPVTWHVLIDVLRDIGLSTLASEIAAIKVSTWNTRR